MRRISWDLNWTYHILCRCPWSCQSRFCWFHRSPAQTKKIALKQLTSEVACFRDDAVIGYKNAALTCEYGVSKYCFRQSGATPGAWIHIGPLTTRSRALLPMHFHIDLRTKTEGRNGRPKTAKKTFHAARQGTCDKTEPRRALVRIAVRTHQSLVCHVRS